MKTEEFETKVNEMLQRHSVRIISITLRDRESVGVFIDDMEELFTEWEEGR